MVKYLISLDKFDVKDVTVFSFFMTNKIQRKKIFFYDIKINFIIYGIFDKYCVFYRTLLHFAVMSNNPKLVKFLVSLNKIDVNAKDILSFIIFLITFLNASFFIPF